MTFSKIDPADHQPRYIKKFGNIVLLTKDKRGALNDIPEGWEIIELPNKRLQIRKKRKT